MNYNKMHPFTEVFKIIYKYNTIFQSIFKNLIFIPIFISI